MAEYKISGGRRLYGEYTVQRAKNSALTIICASVLTGGETLIVDCPKIDDVNNLIKIMRRIGAVAEWTTDGLYLNTKNVYCTEIPPKLSGELRASLFLVGPLLARFKTVCFSGPGGCSRGTRPIDIHLDGLRALGADVGVSDGRINFFATGLRGRNIKLKYPSVGATENVVMCAAFADGQTVIENCAKEPEIVDLQTYLNLCGAKIAGAGTSKICVTGVKKLEGGKAFRPIADRIEAGSALLTVLSCGGEVALLGADPENICVLTVDS